MYFKKLEESLKKSIAPVYLLIGDEPLQQIEGGDMIREAVQKQTQDKIRREVIYADSKFKWDQIYMSAGTAFLFSEKRLIEITLSSGVKTAAADFFISYAENPPPDNVLVVHAEKLDRRLSWVKKLEKVGESVQIYNKSGSELQDWLRHRLSKAKLNTEDGVVEFIAQRVEGNMLAAAQEIKKLSLFCEDGMVKIEDVERSVSLSARYSVYDLGNAAIDGDIVKALHILHSLRVNQVPIPLLVWALAAELRKMATLEARRMAGESIENLLRSEWRNRKEIVFNALQRKLGLRWEVLLAWCAKVDKSSKGMSVSGDDVWDEILILLMKICKLTNLTEAKH